MLPKHILYVSHDANRAGAQLFLLNVMKYFGQKGIKQSILLLDGGVLADDFAAVATVYHWPKDNAAANFTDKLFRRKAATPQQLLTQLQGAGIDCIYANTVATASVLTSLKQALSCKMYTHIHELAFSISLYSTPQQQQQMVAATDEFIACSDAVAANLPLQLGIEPKIIKTVHSFIDNEKLTTRLAQRDEAALRSKHQLPADSFLIGSCGNAEWRKGVDIFLQIANEYKQLSPTSNFLFVWIGLPHAGDLYEKLRFDAERMELLPHLRIIEPTPEAFELISLLDVFVVSSREDPFPLVMLEAALAQKPIAGFDKTGGCSEFVEHDAGTVVPYLATAALAKTLQTWAADAPLRQQLGQRAYEKVTQRYNFEASMHKLAAILSKS